MLGMSEGKPGELPIQTLVAPTATRVWMVVHKGFVQTLQANFIILTLVAGPATWVTSWVMNLRYQIAGSYAWAFKFF